MHKLKVGQPAPDVTLQTTDGRFVQLSDYWGNGRYGTARSTLLIFLRHLA